MGQARPTFERRQLGLTLRRLREAAGKRQQEVADVIGKARSRIVQLEGGTATVSQEDLEILLKCYEVTDSERDKVLELGAQARTRQKRRSYVDQLPGAYHRFADLEANASEIDWFEPGIIPGLLQSPRYIRALLAEGEGVWWEPSDPEREDRLAFREARQRRVFETAAERIMRFVLTEDSLRANLGSPDVMGEQLQHILNLLDEHRSIDVRVLRNDAYGNPTRGAGLLIFRFGNRGTPVGYSPAMPGLSMYYDDECHTRTMLLAFDKVWDLALNKVESRRLMEDIGRSWDDEIAQVRLVQVHPQRRRE